MAGKLEQATDMSPVGKFCTKVNDTKVGKTKKNKPRLYKSKYYKIVNRKGHPIFNTSTVNGKSNYRSVIYHEGHNVDPLPFNPNGECECGGIYFTDVKQIYQLVHYGEDLYEVEPIGEVYHEDKKSKAHEVNMKYLGKWWDILCLDKIYAIYWGRMGLLFNCIKYGNEPPVAWMLKERVITGKDIADADWITGVIIGNERYKSWRHSYNEGCWKMLEDYVSNNSPSLLRGDDK